MLLSCAYRLMIGNYLEAITVTHGNAPGDRPIDGEPRAALAALAYMCRSSIGYEIHGYRATDLSAEYTQFPSYLSYRRAESETERISHSSRVRCERRVSEFDSTSSSGASPRVHLRIETARRGDVKSPTRSSRSPISRGR